jgi:hypothetical protein
MCDKKTLVQGMRDMSIERHGRVSVTTKAKWVIYQKDKLSGLVEELSKLLVNLEGVLLVDDATLAPICDNEASHLLSGDQLDLALAI